MKHTRLIAVLAVVTGVLFLAMSGKPAFACGAEGGDNRPPAASCAENSAAHPAVHPAAAPAGATAFPVDLVTGNKFLAQRDTWLPGALSLTRYYNSRHQFGSSLGIGWRHAFQVTLSLRLRPGQPASAQIIQGDGRRIVFRATSAGGSELFQAIEPAYGALVRQSQLAPDRRWHWQWQDGSRFFFNELGRLTAVEKAAGQRLTLEYGGKPVRLMSVSNRHGQHLRFSYGPAPHRRLTQVDLPDGQNLTYHYDPQHLLIRVSHGRQVQWRFEHADAHLGAITRVIDAKGSTVNQLVYGEQRRVVYAARANGVQAVRLAYRLAPDPASFGHTELTEVSTGQQARYRWRYDPVTQQRQWLGGTGEPCGFCPATTSRREFDRQGRLVSVLGANGQRASRQYDKSARLAAYRWISAHGARLAETRIHYESPRVDAMIRQLEQPSLAPGRKHRITFTRDSRRRIVLIEQAGFEPVLGTLRRGASGWQTTRWKKISRQWRIRYVDFGAAVGLIASIDGPLPGRSDIIHYRYDQAGRRVAQLGPFKQWRRWAYGPDGLLASITSDEGASQAFKYDRFNRIIARTTDGRTTDIQRDVTGRRQVLAPLGRPLINLVRNPNGDLIGLTDQGGNRLQVYRSLERRDSAIASESVYMPGRFRHELKDDFARIIAVIDSETGIHRTVFDLIDRPVARLNDRLQLELYKYDRFGRFAGITAANGNSWSQRYRRGRLIWRSSAFEQIRRQYNSRRQLIRRTISYADKTLGQGFPRPLVLGRTYDEYGRLSHRDIGHSWQLRYRWRATHELAAIELLSPVAGDGRRSSLVLASSLQWQALGDGQTGLLAAHLGNGIRMKKELDQALRVNAIRYEISPGVGSRAGRLPDITVGYDDAGRVVRQSVGGVNFTYQYNQHGWLTGYQSAATSRHWSYRPDGLRQLQSTDKQPRLIKAAARPAGQSSPRLALPGAESRLVKSPNGAQVLLDAAGRPRYALSRQKQAYRYIYNPIGVRIGKLNLGRPHESRWFIYDNKRLFIETDASGQPLRVFIRLDDRPLAVINFSAGKPVVHWVHADLVGQPVATTDQNAQLSWRGLFGPFGEAVNAGAAQAVPDWLPLRLPGQYYDPETGFHDNYRRTYNPAIGAYLGPDPLGQRAGGYRYAYAANSPLDTIDPLGLYEIDMHYYASFAIALAAGMSYDEARTIANANQHVDDHIDTEPIIRGEDGNMNLVDTVLFRARVLRQWHFVLETPVQQPDGSIRYEVSTDTRISNPTSPRLRTLRRWVDGADERMTQMFRLGAYSHAYMDTAAHRYPDNRPIPATVSLVGVDGNLALGHGAHFHYPDYTYNTCPEDFPDGELPSFDQDRSSGLQEWPNNESRTLTIQQDIYELYREFSNGPATVSWEQLEQVLIRFNATRESAIHGQSDADSFPQKMALLEQMLADAGVLDSTSLRSVRFLPSVGGGDDSSYDERQARLEWDEYFSDPGSFDED